MCIRIVCTGIDVEAREDFICWHLASFHGHLKREVHTADASIKLKNFTAPVIFPQITM